MSTDLSQLSARIPPLVPLAGSAAPSPAAKTPAKAMLVETEYSDSSQPETREQVRENIREATSKLNEQMLVRGRRLSFEIDEQTDQIVVTVRDVKTGEVIRQIPSEALLRVAHNIEQIKGLLHNEVT